MAKMLRKAMANEHVCMYGEKCCAPYPIETRAGARWKVKQRRISRRREANEWKKETV